METGYTALPLHFSLWRTTLKNEISGKTTSDNVLPALAHEIPEPVNICVIDVSFISLTLILPKAFELLTPDGVLLGLIKPQFELRPEDVGRGGVVRDSTLHEKAKQGIVDFVAREERFAVVGIVPSAITGMDGNQEFFICLRKKIGLIAHTGKTGVADLVNHLAMDFEKAGVSVLVEKDTAEIASRADSRTIAELGREADLLVVLGGDGTILNVVGQLRDLIKPIFGINVGSLGFLTCLNSSGYQQAVECIVSGQIAFSERTLLKAVVRNAGGDRATMIGLNDAVF